MPGANIDLTVDLGCSRSPRRRMGDQQGAVVVLDRTDGEVLAMVSKPAFDPNVFARGITERGVAKRSSTTRSKPLSNKAIQGQYPPGSTFKIVVATARARGGRRSIRSRASSAAAACTTGTTSSAAGRRAVTAAVNLHEAIVGSCDVYFYQVGQRLGVDTIAEYAHRLRPRRADRHSARPRARRHDPGLALEAAALSASRGTPARRCRSRSDRDT